MLSVRERLKNCVAWLQAIVDSKRRDWSALFWITMKISETIRSARTPEGQVLLDIYQGQIFSINAVGSRILELLEEGLEEIQISRDIARVYEIDLGRARSDVQEFLNALKDRSIVLTTKNREA
jgi:hypothetical protein